MNYVFFAIGALVGGFVAYLVSQAKVMFAREGEQDALNVADVQTRNAEELREKLDICLEAVGKLQAKLDERDVEVDKLRVELKKYETPGMRLGRLGRIE